MAPTPKISDIICKKTITGYLFYLAKLHLKQRVELKLIPSWEVRLIKGGREAIKKFEQEVAEADKGLRAARLRKRNLRKFFKSVSDRLRAYKTSEKR